MFNDKQLAEIDAMLRKGVPMSQIAAHMGVALNTFNLFIARRGKQVVKCLADVSLPDEAVSQNS